MVCVFDIESVPDIDLLRDKYGFAGSEVEICQQAFNTQKEKSGSEFLPVPFHRIISIACVMCDEFGHFNRVGSFGKNAKEEFLASLDSQNTPSCAQDFTNTLDRFEENLLREFWKFFNKHQPALVSFNGRGFDLIALTLRAMRYNIEASAYFEKHNPQFNKDKWENYRSRYSERFHTDLLESLGNFGSVRALNLDTLCQMCKIVGKFDMQGSQVFEIFYGSENTPNAKKLALEQIESYCQSDVLNTYWVYLKFLIVKGELLLSDYADILTQMREKLPLEQNYYEPFSQSIDAELARLKNAIEIP